MTDIDRKVRAMGKRTTRHKINKILSLPYKQPFLYTPRPFHPMAVPNEGLGTVSKGRMPRDYLLDRFCKGRLSSHEALRICKETLSPPPLAHCEEIKHQRLYVISLTYSHPL